MKTKKFYVRKFEKFINAFMNYAKIGTQHGLNKVVRISGEGYCVAKSIKRDIEEATDLESIQDRIKLVKRDLDRWNDTAFKILVRFLLATTDKEKEEILEETY